MRFATLAGFGLAIAAGSLVGIAGGSAAGGLAVAGAVAAVYFFTAFLFQKLGVWGTMLVFSVVGVLILLALSSSTEAGGGEDC